jgi:RHS repeat-associated protein
MGARWRAGRGRVAGRGAGGAGHSRLCAAPVPQPRRPTAYFTGLRGSNPQVALRRRPPENTRAARRLASNRAFRCDIVPEIDTVEVSGSLPLAPARRCPAVPRPAPLPYWDLRGQRRFDPGPLPVYKTRMPRRREGFVAHANRPAGGPPRHAHSDQLGSERLAAWANQTLVSEEAYAPFGEAYAGAGAGEQMFTGKGQRLAAGIHDFPFRHYSPAQGRWLSPDPSGPAAVNPANPQSWNEYAYVGDTPLEATDQLGLSGNADCGPAPGTQPSPTVIYSCDEGGIVYGWQNVNVASTLPPGLPLAPPSAIGGMIAGVGEGLGFFTNQMVAGLSIHPNGPGSAGGGFGGHGVVAAAVATPQAPTQPVCSTGGPNNHLSMGDQVDAATINPFTSRGGGVWGANTQSFPAVTNNYTYSGKGIGLDVGVSLQSVWAWGNGSWSGPFHSVNLSIGVFTCSVFWTPGKGGWIGGSFGLGLGLPGVAYEQTNYTCRSGS